MHNKLCCGSFLSATTTPTIFHDNSLKSKSSRTISSNSSEFNGYFELPLLLPPKQTDDDTIENLYFPRFLLYDISYLINRNGRKEKDDNN